jgi:acyl transferase domain-containing protein/NADPH:quinone reductase-like Zn-dependent oxidoreductase/acyl carrier protein
MSAGGEHDIAIIGMSGRFPGAASTSAFWRNICAGVESVTELSPQQLTAAGVAHDAAAHSAYVKRSSTLDGIDLFDAAFFGYSPREAELMDPQSRLFLESAWEALEGAGYSARPGDAVVGVYASQSLNTYLLRNLSTEIDRQDFILGLKNLQVVLASGTDFLCTRVSYKLDLRGPAVTLQSACSSSLVAVHMARQAILAGECDMALAGGVSIYLPQTAGYRFQDGMILSPDGHCRSFDANANGTVFGRGVGVVLLKRLADALADRDHIYAVIKGSAVNNDGAQKVGFTAPSVTGQAAVICEALADANVSPDSITYIEAHGTGTPQGDPIEIAALTAAFRTATAKTGFCALGTAKANIGHLDAAAGVAGLIKTVLMLEHGKIPPLVHYRRPNAEIDFSQTPFVVSTELRDWRRIETQPLRAGVSSFGMGGTNAHIVLEEAPNHALSEEGDGDPPGDRILALSARSPEALRDIVDRFHEYLDAPAEAIDDVCFSANVCRRHFDYRLAVVGPDTATLRDALATASIPHSRPPLRTVPRIAFLFTGQGSQYARMGSQLYESQPSFREALDECHAFLRRDSIPLLDVLWGSDSAKLDETGFTQPTLFAFEYALAKLWQSWGVEPNVVLGHSLGEYVAACVAGVFSLNDGLSLVAERARLMQSLPAGGGMAAVAASEARIREVLRGREAEVAIAALNGAQNVVISGTFAALGSVLRELSGAGVNVQPLRVSHAFHSPLVESVLDRLHAAAVRTSHASPAIDIISNLSGKPLAKFEPMDAGYWRRHAREPVRFADSVEALARGGPFIAIEIGPHPVLLGMAAQVVADASLSDRVALAIPSMRRGQPENRQMLEALAAVYGAGIDVDWDQVGAGRLRRRVPLPTYAFQRKRYWIEEPEPQGKVSHSRSTAPVPRAVPSDTAGVHSLLGTRLSSPLRATQYEALVDLATVPVLAEHRVFGVAVMPATAYIEIALAVGERLFEFADVDLRNVELIEAMTLSKNSPRRIQTVVQEGDGASRTLEIYSAAAEQPEDWTLHARLSIAPRSADKDAPVDPDRDPIYARCRETLDGLEFYARLAERGFQYGTSFRGSRKIWRRDGEALARVERPSQSTAVPRTFRLDPAHLDSGLQLVFATDPSWTAIDGLLQTLLPVRIERVAINSDGPLPTTYWSHARVRANSSRDRPMYDLSMLDDAGKVLATVSGLELRPASRAALERGLQTEARAWLHHIEWRRAPAHPGTDAVPAIPEVTALADTMRATYTSVASECSLAIYGELGPLLDRLSTDFVVFALDRMDFRPTPNAEFTADQIVAITGVAAPFRRMLDRALEFLEEDGIAARSGERWRFSTWRVPTDPVGSFRQLVSRFPACSAELRMFGRCGENLADVLRGSCDPVALLFPNGSIADLEALYTHAPFTRAYNMLVRNTVVEIADAMPVDAKLRILEIGAGTGGTATWVLPPLQGRSVEYTFTDVSPLFLARAEEKFGGFPFVRYSLLDAGVDPFRQDFSPRSFDLVLATNVLHATRNMRQTLSHVEKLLTPGGCLVAVEGVRRQRWVDLIFGLTEGWWLFEDLDLRPSYPLLSRETWRDLLDETGFDDVDVVPAVGETDLYGQAIFVAKTPAKRRTSTQTGAPGRRWILFTDQDGVGAGLRAALAAKGDECLIVEAGDHFEYHEATRHALVRIGEKGDVAALLQRAGDLHGVVFLWPLDDQPTDRLDVDDVEQRCMASCNGALALVQALVEFGEAVRAPPRLWLVTRGAQQIGSVLAPLAVASAAIWGFGRGVAFEHPELRCVKIDLDPYEGDPVADLGAELELDARDDQVGYREGARYVARIVAGEAALDEPADADRRRTSSENYRLESRAPGVLDTLRFADAARRKPGPGELEIEVTASGLNFVDLLTALDASPLGDRALGTECAGVVTALGPRVTDYAIGDRVMAIAPAAFGRFVIASAALTAPVPPTLSFDAAATVPAAYLTVWHAFERSGGLKASDRVLIHAAAGGVGLAAVLLARRAGAIVYATAGSRRKRELLLSLGVAAVFDSRSTSFAGALLENTGGRGVDVVLNSLAGEFIDRSFEVLRRGGRFLELGKRNVLTEAEAAARRPDVVYCRFDVQAIGASRPELLAPELRAVSTLLASGEIMPLPRTIFSRDNVIGAFRFMQAARQFGKVIVTHDQRPSPSPSVVREDATYLITGGLGGLGQLVARWLAERGARSLVLTGRSRPSAADSTLAELQRTGVEVVVEAVDVSNRESMGELFRRLEQAKRPLRGIIHAAGALDDGTITQQSWERFRAVMRAKVDGSWILHLLSKSFPLDFFVLFSSVAAVLGFRGQANHAAANSFLDALAEHRRALGLPAISINWGAWGEIGAAADRGLMDKLAERGLGSIASRGGIALLESALDGSLRSLRRGANVIVLPVDWATFLRQFPGEPLPFFANVYELAAKSRVDERATASEPQAHAVRKALADALPSERRHVLQNYIRDRIIEKLKVDPQRGIHPDQVLSELGLDSLLAVELRGIFAMDLGLDRPLPSTLLFDYPTLGEVTDFIATKVLGVRQEGAVPQSDQQTRTTDARDSAAIAKQEIEALSDEEAERELIAELEGQRGSTSIQR